MFFHGMHLETIGLGYIFGHVVAGSVPSIPDVDGAIRGMPGTEGTSQLNL